MAAPFVLRGGKQGTGGGRAVSIARDNKRADPPRNAGPNIARFGPFRPWSGGALYNSDADRQRAWRRHRGARFVRAEAATKRSFNCKPTVCIAQSRSGLVRSPRPGKRKPGIDQGDTGQR